MTDLFTPDQRLDFRTRHDALVLKQQANGAEVLFDSCNLDTGHSIIVATCNCNTNPHCTGFIVGIIDFEHGCRAAALPTREELRKLGEALLKASAQ